MTYLTGVLPFDAVSLSAQTVYNKLRTTAISNDSTIMSSLSSQPHPIVIMLILVVLA